MRKELISSARVTSFPIHADQSVTWVEKYPTTIDTVNSPGNEFRRATFVVNILEKARIPLETAEPAPGRGNR
jgi:hypothetical protein